MKKITFEEAAKKLAKKHGVSDIEAEAFLDCTIREGEKEGLALLERIKRKETKILKITYTYKKPKTSEEKREQEVRLARVYDRLFDEVMRRRKAKKM